MTSAEGAPQGNTGDIANWPMLKIVYRTDPEAIAAVLPPGITPGTDPHVNLTIYNVPVPDEPEYGILQTVNADYDGVAGEYALGYGIDQESAIFIRQTITAWGLQCARAVHTRATRLSSFAVLRVARTNHRRSLICTSGG